MSIKKRVSAKNKNARIHIAKDCGKAVYVVIFVRLLKSAESIAFDGYENTPVRSVRRSRNGTARIMTTTLTMSYEAFEATQHLMGHVLGVYGEKYSLQRRTTSDLLEVAK